MSNELIARVVSIGKWKRASGSTLACLITADVLSDVSSRQGSLSFWRIDEASRAGMERAALAVGSTRQKVDKMAIVWMETSVLDGLGIPTANTPGVTPAVNLRRRHVDAEGLTIRRACDLAEAILAAVRADQVCNFTNRDVRDLLLEAIARDGEIDMKQFPKSLHIDLGL